jgi:hypothetical protein
LAPPGAALEKEMSRGERAELLGGEGGANAGTPTSRLGHSLLFPKHHGPRPLHSYALARAFEKKRLAVLAAWRHRSKLSLLITCPLLVLLLLVVTLTLVSRSGAAAAGKAEKELASAYPGAAAALLEGGGAPEALARQKFTVIVNTYKRHDMAKDAVRHYAACGKVHAGRSEGGGEWRGTEGKGWWSVVFFCWCHGLWWGNVLLFFSPPFPCPVPSPSFT